MEKENRIPKRDKNTESKGEKQCTKMECKSNESEKKEKNCVPLKRSIKYVNQKSEQKTVIQKCWIRQLKL